MVDGQRVLPFRPETIESALESLERDGVSASILDAYFLALVCKDYVLKQATLPQLLAGHFSRQLTQYLLPPSANTPDVQTLPPTFQIDRQLMFIILLVETAGEPYKLAVLQLAAIQLYTSLFETPTSQLDAQRFAEVVQVIDPSLEFFLMHIQQSTEALNFQADAEHLDARTAKLLLSRIELLHLLLKTNPDQASPAQHADPGVPTQAARGPAYTSQATWFVYDAIFNHPKISRHLTPEHARIMRELLLMTRRAPITPVLSAEQIVTRPNAELVADMALLGSFPADELMRSRSHSVALLSHAVYQINFPRNAYIDDPGPSEMMTQVAQFVFAFKESMKTNPISIAELADVATLVFRTTAQIAVVQKTDGRQDLRHRATEAINLLFDHLKTIVQTALESGTLDEQAVRSTLFGVLTTTQSAMTTTLGASNSTYHPLGMAAFEPIFEFTKHVPIEIPEQDAFVGMTINGASQDDYDTYANRFAQRALTATSQADAHLLMRLVLRAMHDDNRAFIRTQAPGAPLWFIALATNTHLPEEYGNHGVEKVLAALAKHIYPDVADDSVRFRSFLHVCLKYLNLHKVRIDATLLHSHKAEIQELQQIEDTTQAVITLSTELHETMELCEDLSQATNLGKKPPGDASRQAQQTEANKAILTLENAYRRVATTVNSDMGRKIAAEYGIDRRLLLLAQTVMQSAQWYGLATFASLHKILMLGPGTSPIGVTNQLNYQPVIHAHGQQLLQLETDMYVSSFLNTAPTEVILKETQIGKVPADIAISYLRRRTSNPQAEFGIEVEALVSNAQFGKILDQVIQTACNIFSADNALRGSEIDEIKSLRSAPAFQGLLTDRARSLRLLQRYRNLEKALDAAAAK